MTWVARARVARQDLEALIGDKLYAAVETYELRDLVVSTTCKVRLPPPAAEPTAASMAPFRWLLLLQHPF